MQRGSLLSTVVFCGFHGIFKTYIPFYLLACNGIVQGNPRPQQPTIWGRCAPDLSVSLAKQEGELAVDILRGFEEELDAAY